MLRDAVHSYSHDECASLFRADGLHDERTVTVQLRTREVYNSDNAWCRRDRTKNERGGPDDAVQLGVVRQASARSRGRDGEQLTRNEERKRI